ETGLANPVLELAPSEPSGHTEKDTAGVYLLSSSQPAGGDLALTIIRVDNPIKAPAFSAQVIDTGSVVGTVLPDVAQPATAMTISLGSSSLSNAMTRAHDLVTATTIVPATGPDAGQPTVRWFRIDTTNASNLVLSETGDIGGEDIAPQTATFTPAV